MDALAPLAAAPRVYIDEKDIAARRAAGGDDDRERWRSRAAFAECIESLGDVLPAFASQRTALRLAPGNPM